MAAVIFLSSNASTLAAEPTVRYQGALYWPNLFSCYKASGTYLNQALKTLEGFEGRRVAKFDEVELGVLLSFKEGSPIMAYYEEIDCQEARKKLPGAIK